MRIKNVYSFFYFLIPDIFHFFRVNYPEEDFKSKFESLQAMVEPFKEQLEAYESEKSALLDQNKATVEDLKQLAAQHGKLLGHQNHKQKINHLVQLKTDNVNLRQEKARLQTEAARQARHIAKLEAKLAGGMDKENSFPSRFSSLKCKSVTSTPAVLAAAAASFTSASSSSSTVAKASNKSSPLTSRNRLFH